ncbi:MAG: hypothetical protein IKK00_07075 [Oscillospiraceae bacterium]|nr:hypothetical protein [Oscillospiraceae bacterium]
MMTPEEVRAVEEATRGWTYKEWAQYVALREEHYAMLKDALQMTRDDFNSVFRSVAAWNEWPAEQSVPAQTRMGF